MNIALCVDFEYAGPTKQTNKLVSVRFLWSLLPFIGASVTGFRQYQILQGLMVCEQAMELGVSGYRNGFYTVGGDCNSKDDAEKRNKATTWFGNSITKYSPWFRLVTDPPLEGSFCVSPPSKRFQ
jgi:hypothetical protein